MVDTTQGDDIDPKYGAAFSERARGGLEIDPETKRVIFEHIRGTSEGGVFDYRITRGRTNEQAAAAAGHEKSAPQYKETAVWPSSVSDALVQGCPVLGEQEERVPQEADRDGVEAGGHDDEERETPIKKIRPPAFVFDMDGVIADLDHRLHFIHNQNKSDWSSFFSFVAMSMDSPITPTIALMQALSMKYWVFILTARPERTRDATVTWLELNNVHHNGLMMRPDDDHGKHKAWQWKKHEMAHLNDEYDILGFFDDSADNVDAVGELGIPSILYSNTTNIRERGTNH